MLLTGATAVTGCTSNATTNAKPKVSEKAGTKKQETKKQDTKKQDTKKQDTNNKTNMHIPDQRSANSANSGVAIPVHSA